MFILSLNKKTMQGLGFDVRRATIRAQEYREHSCFIAKGVLVHYINICKSWALCVIYSNQYCAHIQLNHQLQECAQLQSSPLFLKDTCEHVTSVNVSSTSLDTNQSKMLTMYYYLYLRDFCDFIVLLTMYSSRQSPTLIKQIVQNIMRYICEKTKSTISHIHIVYSSHRRIVCRVIRHQCLETIQ